MKQQQSLPPRWVKRIFEWYCSAEIAEDLLGDMDEIFHSNLRTMSPRQAKIKYCLQAIGLIFSSAIKKRKKQMGRAPESYHSFAMYHSYSKIAVRSLAKQKVFALINIICLSVGMSVGLIALAAWVDVINVDDFHSSKSRIYRITTAVNDKNNKLHYASSHHFLQEKIISEATGVTEVVSLNKNFQAEIILSAAVTMPFTDGYYVTPNFLTVFDFPLEAGSKADALSKPFGIVLSHDLAHKLYRDGQALGKTLDIKGLGTFEVTGVAAIYPRSHLYFEALTSLETLSQLELLRQVQPSLASTEPVTSNYIYVLLDEDANKESLQRVLRQASASMVSDKPNMEIDYKLQPLKDIPLSELNNEVGLSWGYISLVIFLFLSLLVLLPACFNYANISVARAMKRAKEIGLRKVSGGQSKHIFVQMVMETIIIAIISLGGAILIFSYVRGQFIQLVVDGDKTFSLQLTPGTLIVFFLFAVLTGFVAGILPASYFSKLNPIETLRNSTAGGKLSKISIRKGLIVSQFALSLVFILGVAIVMKQYRYALNYDLGFSKENILDVQLKGVDERILKAELQKIKEIEMVSMSSSIAGNWGSSSTYLMQQQGDSLEVYQMLVDEHYISNLAIKLLAGRTFREGEENSIVVNEAFLRKNAIPSPHDALGKSFSWAGRSLTIVGVVRDFNFMPLAEEIYPFMFRSQVGGYHFANVKVYSKDIGETLSKIETAWNNVTPQKFEARFLKHELDDSLTSFKSMVKIFGFLGLLAITISSLGLLAVVVSSAESRMREMGVRKVFGASNMQMVLTMASGFIRLIVIAIVIATPLTYIMFNNFFLNMFFYRASIGLTEIGLGIGFLLLLVAIIIGSQTFRVARVNPVETLKSE